MARLLMNLAIAMVAMWSIGVLVLLALRPRDLDLQEARRFVPDVARLVRSLARHPALGWSGRMGVVLLVAYLASPVDLVPDLVPFLGYADDVMVAALVLRSVARRVGVAAIEAHWTGSPAGLRVVRRMAGLHRG